MSGTQQDYISNARNNARAILNAYESLIGSMQDEWNALDYGNTLEDGQGENAGITKAEVGSVVFDTANALKTLFAQGFLTNLEKLK